MEIQYRAVRENAGIFNRSKRGKVRAEGADCLRFLHGMVTNTVESLAENGGNYAAVTSARGQTLLDIWVHRLQDCIYMETEPGLATKLIETLDRYLIADDVALSDESDTWAILGVQGPTAHELIGRVVGRVPTDLPEHHTVIHAFDGIPIWVTARSYTGEPGCDLRIAQDHADSLRRALVTAGGTPIGWQVGEILRVEAGIPRYGAEIDELVVPLEAGLNRAVDFDKGCYIGQEVIAKMHFRGRPRRYLTGLLLSGNTPVSGNIIVNDKTVGRVTTCVKSLHLNRVIALAIIRRGYHEAGQRVLLDDGSEAEVVNLPFTVNRLT
jgi:folate-binding protein YgfZ